MRVAIVWHRFWFGGKHDMGLCALVSDNKTHKINGLPLTEERYWFVKGDDDTYNAYRLTQTELDDLELERAFHQATWGNTINHDSTFSFVKSGEVPECLIDYISDPVDIHLPPGSHKVFNAKLDLTDTAFSFTHSDIVNPGPSDVVDGKCTF